MYLCVDIVSGSNPQIKTIAFWCFRSLLPLGLPLWSTFLVCFFLLRISFGLFPTYQPGKDCWTGPFWKRYGEEMGRCHDNCLNFMILFNAWTCAFFSPGFREKSPKLLLVSTNGAICLDVASTSKGKWRFRLESPCRPQPKNGDVFLVLLETRLKKVVTQGEMRAMPSVVTWCSAWREMTVMRCLFHTALWHFQRFSFWGDGKLRDNRVL